MFDTATRELVYCDPQAGPVKFSIQSVARYKAQTESPSLDAYERQLEADLRRALPRSNRSNLVIAKALKFQ